MRTFVIVSLLFVPHLASRAQTKNKAPHVTIVGEVVDSRCYLMQGEDGRGEKHQECAVECAKEGVPLAILEDKTNLVYFASKARGMAGANEMLMPFIGEKVSATGKLSERGGARMIFVDSIEKTR